MLKLLLPLAVWILVSCLPSLALAANHFIRDGGSASTSGTGACTSWVTANACDSLPTTLVRGDTYYIADGNYPARTFNTAASGTNVITIKKCSAADHGTETGYDPTFCDGQANWASSLDFQTDYWVFTGVYRDDDDWFDGTAYGFRIDTTQNVQIDMRGSAGVNNVEWRYIHFLGRNTPLSTSTDEGRRHLWIDDQGEAGSYADLTVGQSFFQYGNVSIQNRQIARFIVEYNAFADNLNNDENHGENSSSYYDGQTNHIYRFNRSLRMIGTAAWAVNQASGFKIYGNSYCDCEYSDGAAGFTTNGTNSNFEVYNETVVGNTGFNAGFNLGGGGGAGGNVVRNSLFISNSHVGFEGVGTITHNGYSSGASGGTNAQTGMTTAIFVNRSQCDLRLVSGTTAGFTLSAPYNTDMLGSTRGTDGVWDRGAFEFCVGGVGCEAVEPDPVIGLRFDGHLRFLGGVKFE